MNRKLVVDIDAMTDKFDAKINGVVNSVKSVADKMSNIGNVMSLAITVPAFLAAKSMIKLASDSEESLNKVNVAFGISSDIVKNFAQTSLVQFGIASGTALELASNFGDMATSMGINKEAAAQMSTSLVGLAADLSSFKNIDIEKAKNALGGVFTGETESLKSLGVVMTQANLQAYAFSKGIKGNVDDLNESQKVLLRYGFILEKTKNAQGDFARTGGGAANQMRIFQESLKQIGSSFGAIILPYFTKGITYLNSLLMAFNNLGDEAKTAIMVIAGIVATAGPILSISKYVIELGGYLKYLVTPVGLFALAMGAAAIYTLTHWDEVRILFLELDTMMHNFKKNVVMSLVALGKVDAISGLEYLGESFKNVTRWSKDSKVGIQGFVNDFTSGKAALDKLMGDLGSGGGKGKGKAGFDPTDSLNSLAEKLKDIARNVDDVKKEFVEKMIILRDAMKLKDRDGVVKHNQEFAKAAIEAAMGNSLFTDTTVSIEENMKKRLEAIGESIKAGVTNVSGVFIDQYDVLKQRGEEMSAAFSDALRSGIGIALNGFGDLVQGALMKGDKKMNFKKVFANLLGMIGDLLIELGKKAVMINVAIEAIKFPTGAAGVAIGLGLIAAGGALKAASANMNSNSNVNTQKNTSFAPTYGSSQLTVNVVGSLKGDGTSLIGTFNNTANLYGV